MILKELVDMLDLGCKSVNKNYSDIRVCELGNQGMKWHEKRTGKNYMESLGVIEHISLDVNGRDGALPVDLSKPINRWHQYFEMVTNFGTAEHVKDSIYTAFLNIHNFTKLGGVMIHAGPPAGGCPWHSPYHYQPWFFEALAKANNYRVVLSEVRLTPGRRFTKKDIDRSLVCAVLVKEARQPFMTEQEFKDLRGIEGL